MISICFVPTNITFMNSFGKVFLARMCSTFRTGLRRSIWVDTGKVDLVFFGYPFQQIEKLTVSEAGGQRPTGGIKGMLSQHSPRHRFQVQVLNEYHAYTFLGAEMVGQFELPIFPNTGDVVVKSGNLDSSLLAVLRTLFRSGIVALQQLELAVQRHQESGSSNEFSIRCCQKLFQSQVDTQCIPMRLSIGYRHIRLYGDKYFPPIRLPQYP